MSYLNALSDSNDYDFCNQLLFSLSPRPQIILLINPEISETPFIISKNHQTYSSSQYSSITGKYLTFLL